MRFIATYPFQNNDGAHTASGEFESTDIEAASSAVLHAALLILGAHDVTLSRERNGDRITFTGHSVQGSTTAIVAPV